MKIDETIGLRPTTLNLVEQYSGRRIGKALHEEMGTMNLLMLINLRFHRSIDIPSHFSNRYGHRDMVRRFYKQWDQYAHLVTDQEIEEAFKPYARDPGQVERRSKSEKWGHLYR